MALADEKSVPNDLGQIDVLARWLGEWMTANAVPKGAAYKLRLAMEEIAANAVMYGFPTDSSGKITVRIMADDVAPLYRLEILDDGDPFNPLEPPKVPDTDAALEDRDIGGLGLFLIENLSEEMAYDRIDDQNRLRISIREGS